MEPKLKCSQRCSEPLASVQRKTPPKDCPARSERGSELLAITLGRRGRREPASSFVARFVGSVHAAASRRVAPEEYDAAVRPAERMTPRFRRLF
jgi:hypothetical protein